MYEEIEAPKPPFFVVVDGSILMGEFQTRKLAEEFAQKNNLPPVGWYTSIYTLEDILALFGREDYFYSDQFVQDVSVH